MKKMALIVLGLAMFFAVQNVYATPALQLYIPGASAETRGDDKDTWFYDILPGEYDLYAIGCFGDGVAKNLDKQIINATILVTVPQGETGSIAGLGAGTFHDDLSFLPSTSPSLNHYPLNKWDDFDFYTYDIGYFSKLTTGLHDYNAETGTDTINPNAVGEVKTFHITATEYSYVHMDMYAYFQDKNDKWTWKANPGSHDVSDDTKVPEPASMILLSIGTLGLGIIKRKKK